METNIPKIEEIEEKIPYYYLENYFINNYPKEWKSQELLEPSQDDLYRQEPHNVNLKNRKTRGRILEPLERVVLAPELFDELIVRCGVPELLDEKPETDYSGVILFGPPGTGKTEFQNALREVYKRAGAYSQDISLASLGTCYVQEFAKNVERALKQALDSANKRQKPSFLSFDEGSSLIQTAEHGASSVSRHYQEAIDVMKKYLGNYRNLVLAVSTNVLRNTIENALTREGRLTSYFIPYPGLEERKRLWNLFLEENSFFNGSALNPQQLEQLAQAVPEEQGAFIEELCRSYRGLIRNRLLEQKGYTSPRGHSRLLSALKEGDNVTDKEIENAINYRQLLLDVKQAVENKKRRNGDAEKEKRKIGFTES